MAVGACWRTEKSHHGFAIGRSCHAQHLTGNEEINSVALMLIAEFQKRVMVSVYHRIGDNRHWPPDKRRVAQLASGAF